MAMMMTMAMMMMMVMIIIKRCSGKHPHTLLILTCTGPNRTTILYRI